MEKLLIQKIIKLNYNSLFHQFKLLEILVKAIIKDIAHLFVKWHNWKHFICEILIWVYHRYTSLYNI